MSETVNRLDLARRGVSLFWSAAARQCLDNLATVVIVMVYIICGSLLVHSAEGLSYFIIFRNFAGYSGGCLSVLLLVMPLAGLAFGDPSHPFRSICKGYKRLLTPESWAKGLWVAILFGPFAAVFMYLKSLLAQLSFGDMDPLLSHVDCTIHFGCPQNWLLPTIVNAQDYFALSVIYDIGWFVLTLSFLAYLALMAPEGRLRSRALLTYFLAWIVPGTLVAWLGHSGGPLFYKAMTGVNRYDQFVNTLQHYNSEVPFSAMVLVNRMIEARIAGHGLSPPGLGISAMPSMHVAVIMVVAIYAWHQGGWTRRLGILCLCFFSYAAMALGWHYGIDVYAAIALVALIWWFTGLVSFDISSRVFMNRREMIENGARANDVSEIGARYSRPIPRSEE